MAVTLKYSVISNPAFSEALRKVTRSGAIKDVKQAYNVARLVTKVDQGIKTMREDYMAMAKTFATLDENGKFKVPEGAPEGAFDVPEEKMGEWTKAVDAFQEKELVIERHPIPLEQLEGCGLTPGDLIALEPVLEVNEYEVG